MVYLFILHFAAYRVTFQSAFLCSPSPYLPYLNNPVSIIDKVVISACSLIDCLCFLSISIPRLSKFVFLFFHILFVIYPYSCMLLLLTCIPYFQLSLLSDTLVYRLCYLPLCCVLLAVGSLCVCVLIFISLFIHLYCVLNPFILLCSKRHAISTFQPPHLKKTRHIQSGECKTQA